MACNSNRIKRKSIVFMIFINKTIDFSANDRNRDKYKKGPKQSDDVRGIFSA